MKLYFPAFFSTSYEKEINYKLRQPTTLALANKDYKQLWKLKNHAKKVAASIHELEAFASDEETVRTLNIYATNAFNHVMRGNKLIPAQHINPLDNIVFRLEEEFTQSECWNVTFSLINMISNSFISGASGAGTILFTAAALTGPGSALLFSMGMAVLAASVAVLAAYSLFVDGRFIVEHQIADIKEGINFLRTFDPKYLAEPVEVNYSTSPLYQQF